MSEISNSPQSYLDFAGLGNLRGQASQKTDKATKETATQFEAMFIQMMLKSMRETVDKSDLSGSETADTFEQMYDRELSVKMAKRNTMGVADMLVKNIDSASAAAEAAKAASMQGQQAQKALPLNPVNKGLPLSQGLDAMPLIRPDKFSLKPAAIKGLPARGAE